MALFDTLGFSWDRTLAPREFPRGSRDRALFRFRRMLPEYVWDAGVLEGNPFTFPEVKTLLEGVTVGGRKLSDQDQILNLAESAKRLVSMVSQSQFALNKATFCELQSLVARNEALEWGHFRGEGSEIAYTPDVALGERGRFTPLPTVPGAITLNEVFSNGVRSLEREVPNPFERAMAFYSFGALQQFFFDGNKRTSRFMMNGVLMSEGIDAVSIPAARAQEFNSNMVEFYITRDATKMMAFIVDCHPSAAQIHEINDTSYDVPDKGRSDHYRLEMPASPQFERAREQASTADGEPKPISPPRVRRYSSEEVRRRARENWLQNYHGRVESDEGFSSDRGKNIDKKQEDTIEKPHSSRHAELGDEPED
jgi:hypothetical protein